MAVSIPDTSPYIYAATASFAMANFVSDLLCIRFSLALGFLSLVLASLTGFDKNGSFQDIPLSEGIVDIPMLINMVFFCLNTIVVIRLWRDDLPGDQIVTKDEEELALFNFFRARCGLKPLQFRHVFKNGTFLDLDDDQEIPNCHRTLYLVIEGRVACSCKYDGKKTPEFVKRSGEFFDIRMFNIFTLPIGFDNTDYQGKTLTKTKLFAWDIDGLVAMRELQSPRLTAFWEFTVLRSLATEAVRHHLKKSATLYDSLLIPEDKQWLEGARSRDFFSSQPKLTFCARVQGQMMAVLASIQFMPPHGVRHRPGVIEPNPKQLALEAICKGQRRRSTLFGLKAGPSQSLPSSISDV